eukprot:1157352-Alexandrium_andersonii.AAC.1
MATSSIKGRRGGGGWPKRRQQQLGQRPHHDRNGLIGPPMPTPVRAGWLTHLPQGRANCACLARMKAMVRTTSHGG